ncbi:MAG: phosphate butyryltransferase Ptb [Oscillospiraceae bacterium]|jgi:phosphotransacetylase|nr:phosphate butyryltransferase Ptb [Oscillospiraceae bacterium]
MDITTFEGLARVAAGRAERAVLAVALAEDAHTLEAVVRARREGVADAVLIGDDARIRAMLAELGAAEDFEIVPAVTEDAALGMMVDLVRSRRANAVMKGRLESADFLRAILARENGLRGEGKLSLIGFYETRGYHKLFAVTDMGVNTTPDLAGKREILENAAALLRRMGVAMPKIAVLSESERVNAKIPASVDADALKKLWAAGEITGCVVEGPIAFDLATSAEAAAIKGYASPVAGDADLLLVPDIVAGNILVKCLTGFAGARTAGTILGARLPVVMTSRSAEAEDKFYSIALAAIAAGAVR